MSSTTTPAAAKLAEARRTTNLRVLQRLDPQIVDLAITASHVVLYQFSLPQNQWIKKNIEGTLFVCKRSDVPRFKLIVSNRNSTENLEVGITSTFQMQVREPYLIFRDNNTTTVTGTTAGGGEENEAIHPRGLWFHDDTERQQVHSFLENVVKSLQTIEAMEREHGPPPSLLLSSNDDNTDNAVSGAKKPPLPSPVEVNTNAAGAALLSTLTLNNDNTNNNNNTTSSSAVKSRKSPSSQPQPPSTTTTATPQSNNHHQNNNINNNALDKKSLQLALLSLIREERFLDLIHAQYLKVVSSRAQREQQQHHQQQQQEE